MDDDTTTPAPPPGEGPAPPPDPSMPPGRYLTPTEAARLLGVHPNTVRARLDRGIYPYERMLTASGEARMIPRGVIEAEVRARLGAVGAPPPTDLEVPEAATGWTLQEAQGWLQEAIQGAQGPLLEAIQARDATIQAQAEELGAVRARAAHLEARLAEEQARARRPWWRRIL